jgi:hypothetical protein
MTAKILTPNALHWVVANHPYYLFESFKGKNVKIGKLL